MVNDEVTKRVLFILVQAQGFAPRNGYSGGIEIQWKPRARVLASTVQQSESEGIALGV
jgi:hypothetical protein